MKVRPARADTDPAQAGRCGRYYAAPYSLGAGQVDTFSDAVSGVTFRVLEAGPSSYRVQVQRP